MLTLGNRNIIVGIIKNQSARGTLLDRVAIGAVERN